jgi:methyl-accepting chemotaxis protein
MTVSLNQSLNQALETFKQGNYAEAKAILTELAQANPDNAQIRLWLGAACRESGFIDEAIANFQEVLVLATDPRVSQLAQASLRQLEASEVALTNGSNGTAIGSSTNGSNGSNGNGSSTNGGSDDSDTSIGSTGHSSNNGKAAVEEDVALPKPTDIQEVAAISSPAPVSTISEKTSSSEHDAALDALVRQQAARPVLPKLPEGMQMRVLTWALAITGCTALAVGGLIYILTHQAISRQITALRDDPAAVKVADLEQLQQQQFLGFVVGTGGAGIVAVGMAGLVARQITRPLMKTVEAAQQLAYGELGARVPVQGNDELAALGTSLNAIADRLQGQIRRTEEAEEQALQAEQLAKHIEQAFQAQEREQALEKSQAAAQEAQNLQLPPPQEQPQPVAVAPPVSPSLEQLQTAIQAVTQTAQISQPLVVNLAHEMKLQEESVRRVFKQFRRMANLLEAVAVDAGQAGQRIRSTEAVFKSGDEAIDRTATRLISVRENVIKNRVKVEYLGEVSQKIAHKLHLINHLADQTQQMAFSSALPASQAAVEMSPQSSAIAITVRSLSQQIAFTTAEIEQFLLSMQSTTNQILRNLSAETEQTLSGEAQLLDDTRQTLNQVAEVSLEISTLVEAIAQAASTSWENSAIVGQSMQHLVEMTHKTSEKSGSVAASFAQLLCSAQELNKYCSA